MQRTNTTVSGFSYQVEDQGGKDKSFQTDVNPGGDMKVCQCAAGECGSDNLERFNR